MTQVEACQSSRLDRMQPRSEGHASFQNVKASRAPPVGAWATAYRTCPTNIGAVGGSECPDGWESRAFSCNLALPARFWELWQPRRAEPASWETVASLPRCSHNSSLRRLIDADSADRLRDILPLRRLAPYSSRAVRAQLSWLAHLFRLPRNPYCYPSIHCSGVPGMLALSHRSLRRFACSGRYTSTCTWLGSSVR